MVNPQGLHARPAQMLVVAANRYQASIAARNGERQANAKSILDVMTLQAHTGTELVFEAEGSDAQAAVDELAGIVRRGFDEM